MKLKTYKINGASRRGTVIAMGVDAARRQVAFEPGFALGTGNALAAAGQRAA